MDRRPDVVSRQLTWHEQRALASFLAGRLPAGQLETELARARGDGPVVAASVPPPAALAAVPALSAA